MSKEDHDPEKILIVGTKLLDPILEPRGFRFLLGGSGIGSGGRFASGKYSRENRSLELHFRCSLGLVTYHIQAASMDHETYMRMLGVRERSSYPDFPKDPLDSFRSLASDLELYCEDFLSGTGDQFLRLSTESKHAPRGLAQIP
jgi:hypothetical protein